MSNNWHQPNGGAPQHQQNGAHHPSQPPNPYGQMQNNPQNMNQVAPYAALGGAVTNVGNTQAPAYNYSGMSGGAAQNAQYYATGQPNNHQSFSYSTLGTFGAMGNGGQVQSAGNYAAMGSVAAPASSYGNMAAAHSGGNPQQVVWPWNANTPQHQQLQYSQQGYPGYGQIQAPLPYNGNASSSAGFQPQQPQPQHLQVAIPPPPPPPPASYLDKDGMQGELAASARRERMATREDVPKKPPPPAPRPPPAPNPPTANVPPNVMLTDSAVSAISALSSLDQQWSAKETAKKERRRAKRKRQRSRKKKNGANKGGSSDGAGDAAEPGEVWIDVDHGPPNKKQQQGNGFDLAAGVKSDSFPPLAPAKSSGEEEEDDAARLASMEGMSTSQLTSYAAVLGMALDQKTQDASLPLDGNDEEMDISEDEEEEVAAVNLTSGDGPPADAPTSPTPNDDAIEKEQRALKLAELRAKAKLARAKLRVAEQKKARGSAARDSLDSTKDGESTFPSVTTGPSQMSASMYFTTGLAPPVKAAITAMRNLGSLVIDDVSATGPEDEVRFVDSVYRQQMPCDDRTILERTLSTSRAPARTGINPPPANVAEENRKKSETLKQQLHLARLQLEIKKKELQKKELERKQNGALPVDEDPNQEDEPESAVALNERDPANQQKLQLDSIENSTQAADDKPSADQAHATLEELRRRQKELKQKNDIASLRNIVHRQRDLLQAQGRELSESSSQLQSCVDSTKSKQQLLEKSDQKLEELHHRKRIMEGMVFRATEQLMTARKALNERRQGKRG